jgi:outer membrane receptor protein involved in Fe transport
MLTLPGPWQGARLGINLRRVGERLTLAGASLAPYLDVNTSLTYARPGAPWSLGFGIYNLTNQRHADPVGPDFLQDAVQQQGRNWRLQLGWAF